MDWTIPRRLLRSPRTKKLRHAYRAVWQGQVLHHGNGGAAFCKCGEPRTLQHVMYECPRSRKYRLSQAAVAFRRRFPHQCFWLRGMVPTGWTRLAYKAEKCQTEKTGIFLEGEPDVSGLVVGTDASGGPQTKDPPQGSGLGGGRWATEGPGGGNRRHSLWRAHAAFHCSPREHAAIIEAIHHTSGILDLTTDCKGALKTLQARHPHKTVTPEWGDVWQQRDRVRATWVRAHKEADDFEKEFPQQEWRRQLNLAADALAGQRAKAALNPHAARKVQEVDRIATEVNDYLALRAEEQLQNEENQFVPKSIRDTMSQFDKKQQKPHAKALYANKRDRLKQMVLESSMGHAWQYTRGEKATNLQLKCAVCDLGIQQTYSQEVFQRVDSHPCKEYPHQGPQFWPALHTSHKWVSTGKTRECSGCGVSFGPSSAKEPSKATKPCPRTRVGVTTISFAKVSSTIVDRDPIRR